jgi:hypothetical protein
METEIEKIPDDLLKRITAAAERQILLEKKLDELDEQKKQLERDLAEVAGGFDGKEKHVIDGLIPDLMAEANVKGLVLTGGMSVEVNRELKPPSMAADSEMREIVLDWCDRSGNTGVVKNLLSVYFEKGDPRVQVIMNFIKNLLMENPTKLKIEYALFRTVHPMTLKSLFNEILEEPVKVREDFQTAEEFDKWKLKNELPIAELGIQIFPKSKISFPKVKK